MFTPPPSPLPRDFGVTALDTQVHMDSTSPSPSSSSSSLFPSPNSARSPGSLLSPGTPPSTSASSPLRPSPAVHTPTASAQAFRHAASQSTPSISLARPPLGKQPPPSSSLSRKSSHARNSTIAVLAGDKAALARAASQSTGSKKATGRHVRLLAFGVPLLLVAMTVLAQRWRSSAVSSMVEVLAPVDAGLWRRQADDDKSDSASASLSSTSTDSATATPTSGTATPVGDVPQAPGDSAVLVLPTPFPQPFDSSLGNNFTSQSCTSFFSTFTQSKPFRSCRSFGMLLANSHAWFVAARSATPAANVSGGVDAMNALIWGTCHTNTPREECEGTMAGLEGQIRSACRDELRNSNAIAVAALVGFSNWKLYRDVGCIVRPQTNAYCYLEALNGENAEDSYVYTLPLGIDMKEPKPTCSRCSQLVLSKMREYASNATLPISRTYPDMQNATSVTCGSDYALPIAVVNSVGVRAAFAPLVSLFIVICSILALI